jgi:prepilin-type N-terminal cleavage/methylation domain-containing protein
MVQLRLISKVLGARCAAGREGGFSLIEVLMGTALLGIVAAVILSGLSTSMKSNIVVERNTSAVNVAQSQMEYVKTQGYITAANNGEVTYSMITPVPGGYLIGSINRAGSSVASVIGVPWNSQSGSAVSTDSGIQKISLVVKQGSSWSTGLVAFTLDIYKVQP